MREILQKYVNGECTTDEFKKAITVLAGFAHQGTLSDFMHRHWKDYTGEKPEGNPVRYNQVLNQIHHQINISEEKESFTRRFYLTFSRVAAVLLLPLLMALALFLFQYSDSDKMAMTKMTTPAGIQSQVELPDGSRIWLNSESEVHFPVSFKGQKERKVKLIGEGFFEIASDRKKPFIVSAGDELEVSVTGTTFNLSAYENEPDVSVTLVEGSVKIQKGADKNCSVLAEMKPGEVARFDKNSKKISISRENDLEPYTAWKEGRFVFVNEPFESVLRTMERKYHVKYNIEDPRLLKYRITATFLDETLEEFLRIITLSSPIEYEICRPVKEEDNVYLKRVVTLTRK